MKLMQLLTRRKKNILWLLILFLFIYNYYASSFEYLNAFIVTIVLLLHLMGMFLVGYLVISKRRDFPKLEFWTWTIIFSFTRWAMIYFILQYYLPDFTIFHYPSKAIFYVIITTVIFIFLGYSLAIYEWGLVARDQYKLDSTSNSIEFNHPIVLRSNGNNIYVLPDDILFVQANGEYVKYVTKHANHLCFERLKNVEKHLSQFNFMRAHRSFIINPKHIESYTATEISLKNGMSIPISKTYKEALVKQLA